MPRQRNSREENSLIKAGETPERFEANPLRLCAGQAIKAQKDTHVQHDLEYYGNSKTMIGSLNTALSEFAMIERQVAVLTAWRWVFYFAGNVGPSTVSFRA